MAPSLQPERRKRFDAKEVKNELAFVERSVLVTTNMMARGCAIPNTNVVINVDVPVQSTMYYHRATRASGNLQFVNLNTYRLVLSF